MVMTTSDLHCCEINDVQYWFRTPTGRDLPKMRQILTRNGIRRPLLEEFHVAARAGVAALGRLTGDVEEGERQSGVIDEWYRLLPKIREDDIDEPDLEARAVELERLQQQRRDAQILIIAEVGAIEAALTRHWPPYAELLADRTYWDEVSAVEAIRLLLVGIGATKLPRDDQGMLHDAAYLALPNAARPVLAAFASGLLVPSEDEEKN